MPRRILIIDGHPDPEPGRFLHAMASAYRTAAIEAGHEVREIRLADRSFSLLRSNADFQQSPSSQQLADCQELMRWADHWVVLYPLWLGAMPALLKGFFEQVLRPGFAFAAGAKGFPRKLLAGRSARVIVTMGMPAFFYRWYFRSHSLKSFERNILAFIGLKPVHSTLVGNVEAMSAEERGEHLERVREFARLGS